MKIWRNTEIEADGLLARCILHECDPTWTENFYVDLVEGELQDTVGEEEE